MKNQLATEYLTTAVGILKIEADNVGITAIGFVSQTDKVFVANQHTQQAALELSEYFAGKRTEFNVALNSKGTEFQQQVWLQLSKIPYGQTCSYGDIAKNINNPKAVRAVGAANGRNPITIIVPCHRVIGSNGKLTGYAWGTSIKSALLTLESNPKCKP
ncbi:methylated-DNA--[protein]-cysteine S-methyltransferase [Paraglaciecola sp. 2405UD69-4]|uniref:methylated-DNA--[protein]-cysteine S-methyltransferase n=1 Tax=Paraglaciecola sp. 2405UD69-4 TaxID=3391836 RepID=UPI0039C96E94